MTPADDGAIPATTPNSASRCETGRRPRNGVSSTAGLGTSEQGTVPPVPLSHWPTPLDPAPRLSTALGLEPDDLWIKRDDLTDLGGGNKVRKLEHLVAEALALEATVLVTSGGAQSNHARSTAAAAARVGLGSVLVLGGTALAGGPGTSPSRRCSGPGAGSRGGSPAPARGGGAAGVADRRGAA